MTAEILIVIAVTTLMMLPFIARPFHMDDATFIELARARQGNAMETVLTDYTFFGQENEKFLDTHPPFVPSYIALVIVIAGESEIILHLAFLIFPLIATVSMYFLARSYSRHALLVSLIFVATPGIMVMSHGIMSDIPGLSMWLAAVVLYKYGLERDSLRLMVICALAITVGILISYQVLSVIPLLFVYAILKRKLSMLAVLPFVLPVSTFFSYVVWHYFVLGLVPRLSYGVGEPLAWYSIIQKGSSVFAVIGGAFVFFILMMRVLFVNRWDFVVYLAFFIPFWISQFIRYQMGLVSLAAAMLSVLFIPLGILFLYRIFADGWQKIRTKGIFLEADTALLLIWLGGVIFYLVVLMPYSSVRYLLPAFPPMILLFAGLVEKRFDADSKVWNVMVAATLATAGAGILVAGADYQLAAANKAFAANEGARLGRQADLKGGRVWFVGEFGFRYYLEQQGFSELPKDRVIPEGDLVIQSPLADPRAFSDDMKDRVELIEKVSYDGLLPLRTVDFQESAGFYGHFWGILPVSLAAGPVEEYLIYEVVPLKQDEQEDEEEGG
ncbi:MAG: glycosyltransferase family 39 protein [Actinobacteria bacterium]|nr:glycosyltransferase family 39 protein [Actinomycetota bacterium]